MTTPPTEQQLDEIETRANAATPGSWGIYEYGTDGSVTDITAEVRRLRAELAAVHAFLDEQEPAARAFELPTPVWVEAARAASASSAAPLSAVQASSVSESAQSPTGAAG